MKTRDVFELLLLAALWGASFLFMRVAVPEFGPVALIEVRVALAAAFLIPILMMRGGLRRVRSAYWKPIFAARRPQHGAAVLPVRVLDALPDRRLRGHYQRDLAAVRRHRRLAVVG